MAHTEHLWRGAEGGEAKRLLLLAAIGTALFAGLWFGGAVSAAAALGGIGVLATCAAILALLPGSEPPMIPVAEPVRPQTDVPAGDATALLRAVTENMPEPLLLLDRRGWIVEANAASRRLFGEHITNKPLISVLRNPTLLSAVERAQDGEPVEEVSFSLPVPVERHLQAAVSPLAVLPGWPGTANLGINRPALLVLFRDVTAMRRLEQMRVDFVANVSHELRTPLSVLAGFIETLRGPARDDAEARERFLAIMDQQAQRMARLIGDLLSLSRIELDEHVAPTGRVNLADLAREVTAALQPVAAASGVKLEVLLKDPLPPVLGDRDQLYQVVQNLIDNAIKYGGSGGLVSVEPGTPAAPGHVAIRIRDRGEGIPKAHLPRLTERFYRVDTARSRERGGTGLGLAIVKHVVNRHKGRLLVDSVLGQGTVFTVSLPSAPASAVSRPAEPPNS